VGGVVLGWVVEKKFVEDPPPGGGGGGGVDCSHIAKITHFYNVCIAK